VFDVAFPAIVTNLFANAPLQKDISPPVVLELNKRLFELVPIIPFPTLIVLSA
jgi:hypothetical protein